MEQNALTQTKSGQGNSNQSFGRTIKRNITAVCISRKEENWQVPEVPFYCHTEGYIDFPHYPPLKTRDRILYLAARRNDAHKRALELHPETEHFASIDSYYAKYPQAIRGLIGEYRSFSDDCILGVSNWYWDHSKIPMKVRYWDTWATPEMKNRRYNYYPVHEGLPKGWERVGACGGFAIYPRWVWEKRGYGIPEPFPEAGNEVNYLCQCPGIKSYLTLNVKVFRETPEEVVHRSLLKKIQTTIGLRTRLGLKQRSRQQGL